MGGLLTHGAIVARELEIPCIVNAENVTLLIEEGQDICIDAEEGLITF
jgi:pyruvate,water dikinase